MREEYDHCTIKADRDQTKILFDNLITNAIKYSPKGGCIRVEIAAQSDTVTIRVADDGPGIPEPEREHVFNPFYQSNRPARSHVQGTGIGLSVVREVTRAHGGEICIVDHRDACGACLQVSMPLAPKSV